LYRHLVLFIGYIVKGALPLEVASYSLTLYHSQGMDLLIIFIVMLFGNLVHNNNFYKGLIIYVKSETKSLTKFIFQKKDYINFLL
jgi:hypothetical protein